VFVLASTSCVFLIDPAHLRERIQETADHVVKLSVGRTPVEVLPLTAGVPRPVCSPPPLSTTLAGRDCGRHSSTVSFTMPSTCLLTCREKFFSRTTSWSTTRTISGSVANCESQRFHAALSRLPELADKGAESHIAERGNIRNSWLASGVEVEGTVEDSILFPQRPGTAQRTRFPRRRTPMETASAPEPIQSALILPFTAEVPRPMPNIGDNCTIGARTSTMKNSDYPSTSATGLRSVGMNADIPNGFKAEAATFIAPGVPANVLKRIKVLHRGGSVLGNPTAARRGGGNGSGEMA